MLEEVFVQRMGNPPPGELLSAALESYLYQLRPRAPLRASGDASAQRGRALFETARCSTCHSGPSLTNNHQEDVGTGETLQVPSLVAVAHRLPVMHTGCAHTLRERFDPECGGGNHGDTAQLSEEQLGELVAYMKTL